MGYDRIARVLHWLTALLVLTLIPAGIAMTNVDDRGVQDTLFIFHKNGGAALILLLVLRLGWRATHPAPALPAFMPAWQRIAARISHAGLYVMLLVMAASGYVRVRAGGFPVEGLDALGVPGLVPRDDAIAETARSIHAGAKFALVALIVLHVGAAIRHAMRRDGVFSRMWPPTASNEP